MKIYVLHNEVDGWIYEDKDASKVKAMKKLYEQDDKENGVNIGKYWIDTEERD